MSDPVNEPVEEFAPTPDHEYQGAHFHDDDEQISDEERARRLKLPPVPKKAPRKPPSLPRHFEE